jgi:hypothetical protein
LAHFPTNPITPFSTNQIMTEQEETALHLKQAKERRTTRQSVLQLIQETETKRKELIRDGQELANSIDKGNTLFNQIIHSREGALDAHYIKYLSECSLEKTTALHVGEVLNPKEFCEKLKLKYSKDGELDFQQLGRDYIGQFARSPSITFMFGPIKSQTRPTLHNKVFSKL